MDLIRRCDSVIREPLHEEALILVLFDLKLLLRVGAQKVTHLLIVDLEERGREGEGDEEGER